EETRPTGLGRARGLVSSRRSGARVDASTLAPSPDLADVVATHWYGRWDLRDEPPHTTELLGDPCVHIVVERSETEHGARVVGVWTRRWQRTLEARGWVRGIKLRAGAVRALLPGPAHRWSDHIIPLRDTIGVDKADTLEQDVAACADDHDGCMALDAWARAHRRAKDADDISLAVALAE